MLPRSTPIALIPAPMPTESSPKTVSIFPRAAAAAAARHMSAITASTGNWKTCRSASPDRSRLSHQSLRKTSTPDAANTACSASPVVLILSPRLPMSSRYIGRRQY
ncbi:hypothetical protein RHE_CH02131 [Rhizobium etli CFN 42]|uniref:Uncharacterized protein n=1 Tax=Rhizobium etli (strain ATCC 51251 / DSM 11541 / JCM 21823 / NBRC 15573 / CFN 42) TaxID=347834 RepID=Q2K8C1_RHIEC|nr:hypothetical protein RHE_CH02131 [Rhizobium etli CFN 42]